MPAIQYSHSGEASASVQEGSSLESAVGVTDPSARAAMMLGTSREASLGYSSRGKRSWLLWIGEYEDRKVRASS